MFDDNFYDDYYKALDVLGEYDYDNDGHYDSDEQFDYDSDEQDSAEWM